VEPTREELLDLRAKYVEMLRLRVDDAAGSAADPRAAMAALARRFPGALREIDELPLDEIRARAEALQAAAAGLAKIEPWMAAMVLFHALTRGALAVKRWLAGRRDVDLDTTQAFALEVLELPHAADAMAWRADLARLASPPRGRVTDLVFERIARELGVSDDEARRLMFGVPRRERRATRSP
jgi:hypothetical protein